MPRKSDLLAIYRVARYYYMNSYTQQRIAQIENISRSQVSRMLEKALQLGIARVELQFPAPVDLSDLSDSLSKELGLKRIIIAHAKQYDAGDRKEITMAIARTAAENLPQLLKGSSNIGIGWGRTIYQTSLLLEHFHGVKRCSIIPLLGTSGCDAPELHINTITDRFCEKLDARGFYTNISTIRDVSAPLSATDLERLENLKYSWTVLDTAVVGLGSPPGKNGELISEFSREFTSELEQSGTCGDILAQFFFTDGRVFNYENKYTLTAFDILKLKKLNNVICLAGGTDKVEAIITAARYGYIKTLITDSITAELIYKRI